VTIKLRNHTTYWIIRRYSPTHFISNGSKGSRLCGREGPQWDYRAFNSLERLEHGGVIVTRAEGIPGSLFSRLEVLCT